MKRLITIALAALALIAAWLFVRPSAIEKQVRAQSWTLVRLDSGGAVVPLPNDAEITLKPMGGRRYVGSAGVNSYEVHLAINRHGKIRFTGEEGGVTEMAGPPHLMAIEDAYIAALWQIKKAEISGTRLVLKGPGVQLDYDGKPAPPLDESGSPEDTVSISIEDEGS